MQKYIKKPIIVEALQWTGENHRNMWVFLEQCSLEYIHPHGKNFYIDHNECEGGLIIKTLEGAKPATIGDFIVKEIKGNYYPCKSNIFKSNYLTQKEYVVNTTI